MNDITNHIKKAADHVRLSEKERRDMSYVVREYMAHKPLPHEEYSSVSIEWFSFAWIKQPVAAALALVFIFGSGVSYAAESALPGDALYSIKTKVNESFKVALATDTEGKAAVQMELAERRIEEAAALAAENRLDAETEVSLAAAFESHAQSAAEEVATIDETDASAVAEITSRFETRLAAHEEVLALVSVNADATNTLASAIRGAGLAVADIRARAEERIAVSLPAATISLAMETAPAADTMMKADPAAMTMAAPADGPAPEARSAKVANTETATTGESDEQYDSRAANRMKTSAETQLKAAQKKLKSSKASKEVKAEAEAQLTLSEDRLEEGRTFLKDKAHAQAYHAFQQSLVISEKLNVLLTSEMAFKKAGTRAAEARSNARTKTETTNTEPRGTTTNAKVQVQVNVEATGTPVKLEVETEAGETIHEVIPVIPPTLRIFKNEGGGSGFINIGL